MLLLYMLFAFSAFGQSPGLDLRLTEEEKAWIAEHPVITSTNEMEWAPLDFVRDNEPLGLSIVKNLADLHVVKFNLESEVGKGTKAKIDFPSNRIRN